MLAAAAVLAAVLILLAIPVRLAFSVHRHETLRGAVVMEALDGRIRLPLRRPRPKPRKPAARRKPRRRRQRSPARLLRVARDATFRRRALRFATDVFTAVDVHELDARLRFGLGDPAQTGIFWGFVSPLAVNLRRVEKVSLDVDLEFLQSCFEMDAVGRVRLIPLRIAWLAAAFVLAPSSLRAAWTLAAGGGR